MSFAMPLLLICFTALAFWLPSSRVNRNPEDAAIVLGAPAVTKADGDSLVGQASVIDGDTIEIRGLRVRLWGIDAPESKQVCRRDGKPWLCGGA
ncbi:MAG: hypothetical protein KIT36_19015 [Alphaproteobacteria bacterium]|nr:hypothetical protein [Alphaproteobacteria bacterium]